MHSGIPFISSERGTPSRKYAPENDGVDLLDHEEVPNFTV